MAIVDINNGSRLETYVIAGPRGSGVIGINGAAARLVHEGCAKVLREHLSIAPVRDEAEGSRITLPSGFDASAVRLTGNLVGHPPFPGSLRHRGWRASDVRLPKLAAGHDTRVLAPAEVEL